MPKVLYVLFCVALCVGCTPARAPKNVTDIKSDSKTPVAESPALPQRSIVYISMADKGETEALRLAAEESPQDKEQIDFLIARNSWLESDKNSSFDCDKLKVGSSADIRLREASNDYYKRCVSSDRTENRPAPDNDNPWILERKSEIPAISGNDALGEFARAYDAAVAAGDEKRAMNIKNRLFSHHAESGAESGEELPALLAAYYAYRKCLISHENCSGAVPLLQSIGEDNRARLCERLLGASQSSSDTLRIAAILPLSGKEMKMGRALLGSYMLAAGLFDRAMPGVIVRFFDSASDAEKMRRALEESATFRPNVILIAGDHRMMQSLIRESGDIPVVALTSQPLNGDSRLFSLGPDYLREAKYVAAYLNASGKKKIAIAAPRSAFVDALIRAFDDENQKNGVSSKSLLWTENDKDLRKWASDLAKSDAEAVYFPGTLSHSYRFISFMAQENIWCRKTSDTAAKSDKRFVACIGSSLWDTRELPPNADIVRGSEFVAYGNPQADFFASFEKVFGRKAGFYESMAFYALKFIASSLKQSSSAEQSQAILSAPADIDIAEIDMRHKPVAGGRLMLEPSIFVFDGSDTINRVR